MKIKKLTIHGFKSFPDRAIFAFPPGTSAIVGPNGCGKSNIVDAIRWVLGEQNARHLRGKLMEDLIFTGSDSRKPIGMSEVILTLSNEERNAPAAYANFTEIEIQRRLYRSGESEYFINKVPSRLKDIIELFTDTGIGTRAYSIIEQGQIGWLITAKPEERRVIFEEAAGINKYKHKKDEALRKLEATKQNLTRVNDIVSEVNRQLNSLNRQAKKAERYKLLKEELRKIDLYLSNTEWKRLAGEKSGAREKISEHEDGEIRLAGEISAKEGQIQEINLTYLKKDEDYRALKERAYGLEKLIEERERFSLLSKVREEELKKTSLRLSSDIEELRARKGFIEGEVSGLKEELLGLEKFLKDESEKLSGNESSLENIIAALNEKEGLLKKEEALALEISARITDIRHSMQNCIKDEETLLEREAKTRVENDSAIKAVDERQKALARLKETAAAISERKKSVEGGLHLSKGKMDALENGIIETSDGLKYLKEELAAKRSRLHTLDEISSGLPGLKEGIRAVVAEKHGVHGFVADFIEASPGYEMAVEAALGERLNYVIVDSHREGIEAMEYLKKSSSGRGSFIPIKESKYETTYETTGAGDKNPSEGTGCLKDKIAVKEGYGPIIKNLLDGVFVADDFQSALDIWKQNGKTKTLVTPEGEMIDRHGIITGGRSNGKDAGILQKRKEIRDLKNEIGEIEKRLGPLEEGLKSKNSDVLAAKEAFENSRERLLRDDMERINTEAELKRVESEIEGLKANCLSIQSEILSSEKEKSAIAGKKAAISRERESLEESARVKEGFIKNLSSEVLALKEKKESLSSLITEIRVNLASTREKFWHRTSELKEKQALIEDTEKRILAKETDIGAGDTEIETLKKEAEGNRKALEELLVKKDAMKKEEILTGEGLSEVSGRIKDLEEKKKGLKEDLSRLQEEKGGFSVRLKEIELEMENIKEKTIERYGVDIGSYNPPEDVLALELQEVSEKVRELREKIGAMGEVSLSALEEYNQLEERQRFLLTQQTDLNRSVESLQSAISRINRTTRERFKAAFDEINRKFSETFPKFFNGGRAELRLIGEEDMLESGIEIVAQPPGKKLQIINLLSGGEKALTATALIFSIFSIKPSPFCLLDEVDAPLDDANVDRFNGFVKEMSRSSQFILITHNKRTMEMADTLFGITMEEPGVSKAVAVNL